MKLRKYQQDAVGCTFFEWEKVSSTLGVAATGAGKTQIFCDIIKRRPGRALVLAHRKELVAQAVNRLASFGMQAEIEQGELVASTSLWNAFPVVVATPQTLYSNNFARLKRFKPEDFSTVICDEAHHYSGAPAFEAVVKHFKQNPNLKLLGVTATPDRTDNIAMAKIFDSVAFKIEITDLIKLGYLVDIDQRMATIESLDFSECKKDRTGDLNGADLARVLEYENTLLGMADATLSTIGSKRSVVFAASVKQAERLAEIFNRHKSGCADCVFGHTPPEKRDEVLKRFGDGSLQICVNVGVLTEGYDNPGIEAVVMARATLSRALYAQMAGRGTRPLPGIVENISEDEPEARRRAILESAKPNLLLLDFVGNAGRHKLVTSADILGGNVSEEARERARKKIEKKGGGNMLDELALAEKELREKEESDKRAGIKAKAKFNLTYVDPFDVFKKRAEKWQGHVQTYPLTEKQRTILARNGHNPDDYSPEEGQAIITNLFRASPAQINVLVRAGYPRDEVAGIQKWEASKLIELCKQHNWKRPPTPVEA